MRHEQILPSDASPVPRYGALQATCPETGRRICPRNDDLLPARPGGCPAQARYSVHPLFLTLQGRAERPSAPGRRRPRRSRLPGQARGSIGERPEALQVPVNLLGEPKRIRRLQHVREPGLKTLDFRRALRYPRRIPRPVPLCESIEAASFRKIALGYQVRCVGARSDLRRFGPTALSSVLRPTPSRFTPHGHCPTQNLPRAADRPAVSQSTKDWTRLPTPLPGPCRF